MTETCQHRTKALFRSDTDVAASTLYNYFLYELQRGVGVSPSQVTFHACAGAPILDVLKEKTFRLKKTRFKRRGQNWANQTHKRKEIKFSDHHFLIYANVICRFCIILMCTCHIRKMQKLQIWYGYIKK